MQSIIENSKLVENLVYEKKRYWTYSVMDSVEYLSWLWTTGRVEHMDGITTIHLEIKATALLPLVTS